MYQKGGCQCIKRGCQCITTLSNTYEFVTNSYFDRLNERERENDLFFTEDKAALNFWEFADSGKGALASGLNGQMFTRKQPSGQIEYQVSID